MGPLRHHLVGFACLAFSAGVTLAEPPARTDDRGDPLPDGAVARIGTVRFRQPNVWCLAFSPDGKVLASGGHDDKVILWDPATGKELRSFAGHGGYVNSIAFSRDGTLLAAGGRGGGVRLWQVATGKELRRPKGDPGQVFAVALSPDGKLLAGGADNAVRVWDVATGEELRCFQEQQGYSQAVGFSPDGKVLAIAHNKIDLWDVSNWKHLGSLEGHQGHVTAFAFSPDGRTLCSGSFDTTVRFWDVAARRQTRCIGAARDNVSADDPLVTSLAVSPDGTTVVAGRQQGTVSVWDVATGKNLVGWEASPATVIALAFSPDGKQLATATRDSAIRLWDPATGRRRDPFAEPAGPPAPVQFSPDGQALAAAYDRQTLRVFDAASLRERFAVTVPQFMLGSFAFAPDGRTLAFVESSGSWRTAERESRVRFLDVVTGKVKGQFPKRAGTFAHMAFTRDNTLAGADHKNLVFWDAATGKERRRFHPPMRAVFNTSYSPDGRLLALLGQEDDPRRALRVTMSIWDAAELKKLRDYADNFARPRIFTFTPDGKTLVTAEEGALGGPGDATKLVLWETATGRVRSRLRGDGSPIVTAAFSPDGRVVATTARDDVIRLWDVLTGEPITRLRGHRGSASAVAFAPDGRRLVSGGGDGTLLFWDTRKFLAARRPAGTLGQQRLLALWADLSSTDAAQAYRAMAVLVRHPAEAVALLAVSLPRGRPADEPTLARLLADLDADSYAVREGASLELANLGRAAEPALRRALEADPPPEAKRRLRRLLEALERQTVGPQGLRQLRAVEILERIGTADARQMLRDLRAGGAGPLADEAAASLRRLAKWSTAAR